MKRIELIIFLSLFMTATFGQSAKIDSVQALIKHDDNDSVKVMHLNYLASLYSNQKKFKEAEKHLINSLSLAEDIGSLNSMAKAYFDLSQLYRLTGKPAKEMENYKEYILMRDSISNIERNAASIIHDNKTEAEIDAILSKSNNITIGAILVSVVLLILAVLFLLKLIKANKQNKFLLEQQKPIQTSNTELNKRKIELEEFSSQQKQILEQQKQTLDKYSPIVNSSEELNKQVVDLKETSNKQKQLLENILQLLMLILNSQKEKVS